MRAASESKASLIGIVDDDAGVRKSISSLVRSAGFRAAVFSSAEDFLHSAELKHAACLILDVRMPRMTRLDLQTRLVEGARASRIFSPLITPMRMRKGEGSIRARRRFRSSISRMKPCSLPYACR